MKQCLFCTKTIEPSSFTDSYTYKRAKFCDKACYQANRIQRTEQTACPQCNKMFIRIATRTKRKEFCSIQCQYDARLQDGHKYITPQGYVAIKKHGHPLAYSDGYVLEHRLVMCNKLGRIIASHEHVHHIDGNKKNNQPENLELVNNSTHQILHASHERLNTPEAVDKRTTTRWGHM